jgi:hypothetical protein
VLGFGFDKGVIGDTAVRELFFAQGEAHVARVMEDAARLGGVATGARWTFGCGVGRLVRRWRGASIGSSGRRLARDAPARAWELPG